MSQKWFTAAELAEFALPDMPTTGRGVQLRAEREGWADPKREGAWWRLRGGRGGGIEYALAALPQAARVALTLKLRPAAPAKASDAPSDADIAARWT